MTENVKENAKCKKILNQNYPGNPGHNEKVKSMVIGREESKNSQPKGPVSIFNKITEEIFPNLKKEMSIELQIYWTRKQIPSAT